MGGYDVRQIFDRIAWAVAGISTTMLVLVATGVVDAGPLDPPGPPGSTSGVLRPGTPISSLPYTISTPGSYYVTGNLTGVAGQNGISIWSNDVTLDLSGFTLTGVPSSWNGIEVSGVRRGIVVRNGTLSSWELSGLQAVAAESGVFADLNAEWNAQYGLYAGAGSTLSHCSARANGKAGIVADKATITDCASMGNGEQGFYISASVLTDCVAGSNTMSGIEAYSTSRIDGCTVFSNGSNGSAGIQATSSIITNNEVFYNLADGISVSYSTVDGNYVFSNDTNGISVTQSGSSITNNTASWNGSGGCYANFYIPGSLGRIDNNFAYGAGGTTCYGFYVSGGDNVVTRNTASENSTSNYELVGASNDYAPIANGSVATSPLSNVE
jgi:hypothetical protein